MNDGPQHSPGASFASLVGGIVKDAKDLLRQEVALTKLGAQYELRKAKSTAIRLGMGIGVVTMGGIFLVLMLVFMLEALTRVPLWGCYGIVGGMLAVLGVALLSTGKTKGEAVDAVPRRAVERVKESAHG